MYIYKSMWLDQGKIQFGVFVSEDQVFQTSHLRNCLWDISQMRRLYFCIRHCWWLRLKSSQ